MKEETDLILYRSKLPAMEQEQIRYIPTPRDPEPDTYVQPSSINVSRLITGIAVIGGAAAVGVFAVKHMVLIGCCLAGVFVISLLTSAVASSSPTDYTIPKSPGSGQGAANGGQIININISQTGDVNVNRG